MTPKTFAKSRRLVVCVAGLLGLGTIAAGILAHGRPVTTAKADRLPAARQMESGQWSAHLGVVDEHLAGGHVDAAVRAWHDAYGAALESGTWEGMLAVGDAFMRIGRAASATGGARVNARDAYLHGLIRARQHGSVDGALRSAEAFRTLGHVALVEQCFHIAAELAASDEDAQRKVRDARERWATLQTFEDF